MRTFRSFGVCLAIIGTTFLNGCCCARRICDWGRRPCYRRCDPQIISPCAPIVSPCSPCSPYVSPQPMPQEGYETGNQR
jgi:hypothetical protein